MHTRCAAGLLIGLFAIAGCGADTPSGGIAQGTGAAGSVVKSPAAVGGGDTISVLAVGFGTAPSQIPEAVAIVQNNSATDGANDVTFQYTVYGPGNQVVGTDSYTIPALRAHEKTGIVDTLYTAGSPTIDHIKVQVAAGSWQTDPHPGAIITSQGIQYVPDPNFAGSGQVNGELVSHYHQNLKQVRASGICYDAQHAIVGGGVQYIDLLPGGGTTGASIAATVGRTPASCEIYADLSVQGGDASLS